MSFHKAFAAKPDTEEEEFSTNEIFFSRTDERGVIRAGNAVFRRVSGYDWPDLIGAPHRLIRHSGMPRGLFWLLWRTIGSGKPMVAFVKNRSAQGRYYWVLAAIVPAPGGYVSVRIKPGGELFLTAQSLYAEALAQEDRLTPEQSAGWLLQRLSGQGYSDYADFAAKALAQELAMRGNAEGRADAQEARLLAEMGQCLRDTSAKQVELLKEFEALQSIPTNMRIIASRLEPSGGPVSAISDNYKFASGEISRRLEGFAGTDQNLCLTMATMLRESLVTSLIARLMMDVRRFLEKEDNSGAPFDLLAEREMFVQFTDSYLGRADDAMTQARAVCGALNLSSGEIRRMMLGLDTIRVMGRVESGRLGDAGVGLAAAIDQLDLRHAALARLLQELMDLSALTRSAIGAYQRRFGR